VGTPKTFWPVAFVGLRVFGVPLRGRLPVVDSCPIARLPSPFLQRHNEVGKRSASAFRQRLCGGGR